MRQRILPLLSILNTARSTRFYRLLCLIVMATVLLLSPINAQAAPVEPAAPAVTVEELEDLAAVMTDDAAREKLLSRIRALIASQKDADAEPKVESAGTRLIAAISENLEATRHRLVRAVELLSNVPVLLSRIWAQASDAESRQRWLELIIKVVLILLAGAVGEWFVRLLLRRPRRAVEEQPIDRFWVRLPLLAGRTVLDLVPIAAFGAAAYAAAPMVGPTAQVHVMALTFINAYLMVRIILALTRALLAPAVQSLRILPLTDLTANYLFIWIRRLVGFTVFGFFFAEAALLLGLPASGYHGLFGLVGLITAGLTVVFLLQNRVPVATWIRGAGNDKPVGRLRDRFAAIWHVLGVIYVAATFSVFVLGVEGGLNYLARATAVSAIILIIALLILAGLDRLVDRGIAIRQDVRDRFPALEARANRYLPVLRLVLRWGVGVVATLAMLEAWGLGVLGWLGTPLGKQLARSALSIATVLVVALVFWEAVNAGVDHYLARTDRDGKPLARSTRIRTLLPLFRKVALTVLTVMVTLMVLSELGINIGPLLAAAGVIGLAIGFGAQTLVKDVITGLFILIEDTISVGDYVEVGGHEGTVESLSIRTIRLRDPSGNVHTVPFSDVGTVLNYTRDFSNVVLNIGIAYRENVDDVMLVIEEVGRTMAEDATLGANILSPLVTQGVQNMDDSAVIIRARMQVKAGTQWGLKREFNRRIKNRFDELGIEIPFPQRTITFAPETSTKDTGPLKPPARPAEPESGPVKSRNTDKSGDDGGDEGGEGGG